MLSLIIVIILRSLLRDWVCQNSIHVDKAASPDNFTKFSQCNCCRWVFVPSEFIDSCKNSYSARECFHAQWKSKCMVYRKSQVLPLAFAAQKAESKNSPSQIAIMHTVDTHQRGSWPCQPDATQAWSTVPMMATGQQLKELETNVYLCMLLPSNNIKREVINQYCCPLRLKLVLQPC